MSAQPNRVQAIIERRLLTPAYLGMIAGLLIRSVALVLSVAVPYATWPVWVRVGVEFAAALGMIGCADIVLSAASSAHARGNRELAALRVSTEYQASPRLAPAKRAEVQTILDGRRVLAEKGLESEINREKWAIIFAGGITITYGLLFGLTVLASLNLVTIAVEIIGVGAIPFITWYVSAQYHETTASPEERAKAVALGAVDGRLQQAQERFARGEETVADVDLIEASMDANPHYRKLVQALRRPDPNVRYLTTPDLYRLFGAESATQQSTIRRIVRKAGEAHAHGVTSHPKSGAWLTPAGAVVDLFESWMGGEQRPSKKRTPPPTAASLAGASTEPGPDVARTPNLVYAKL